MSRLRLRKDDRSGLWQKEKFYRPPTEFSEGEFDASSRQPEKLVAALERTGVLVPHAESAISRLNDLLEDKNLHKLLRKTTPKIKSLVKQLKTGQSVDIRSLNRLLIEINYPSKTPNKQKLENKKKTYEAITLLKNLRGDDKFKVNHGGVKFNSWKELSEAFGVSRVTIYRWREGGRIRTCYLSLINRIGNDLEGTKTHKNNFLKSEIALKKLDDYKANKGSWDAVAKSIGTTKRTIMRWKKSGNISQEYQKHLYYFFNERTTPPPDTPASDEPQL